MGPREAMSTRRLIVAEPRAAYLHRPRLVVDASVFAAIVFNEKNGAEANGWLRGRTLCAPSLVDLELANTGLNKIRRQALSLEIVNGALEDFASYEIERQEAPFTEAFRLGREYGLTAYDASYLWLADSLGVPLVTFDAQLGEAAKRHLGGTPPAA